MSKRFLLVWLAVMLILPAALSPRVGYAQQTSTRRGGFAFTIDRAESRDTLELPSFAEPLQPVNGEYLVVWLTVTNTGDTGSEYDYCLPEVVCVTPLWFEVVDETGAAYPVDETARSAFEQTAADVLPFGAEIPPGATERIVLVFDVPANASRLVLRSTDQATTPFTLPIAAAAPEATPTVAVLQAEMNQTVPVSGIDLVATRAEERATIDLPSQPAPFVPQGEYVVVYLTVTNASGGPAEYDICPPDERRCLSQLWFALTDAEGTAFPVETIAWSAFSLDPRFLPFGSELPAGTPEPIALVFDVPAGEQQWWLTSTPDAPRPFSIRLQLSPAPGSIQVTRGSSGGEGSGGAAIELILDTSGSMLQDLEGQRRIDIAREVLGKLVTETIPPGAPLALRVFGDTPDSCDTNLLAPLQPLDPGAMSGLIAGLQAIDGVKTPIGASLDQVATDLQDAAGTRIVVLVTDGEETCGGDPAATLAAMADQGMDVHVNIVGFAVTDEAIKRQFREWAHLGNGQYFDAAGAADLGAAIAAAVQPPFRVLDASGNEIARGLVDGDPVEVPAGDYTVEILASPTATIANVSVASGERAVATWGGQGG